MVEDNQTHNDSDKANANANVTNTNALNTLSVTIRDKNVLYATYMSFVKPDGGLFIPTKREFAPGDRLSLLLTIINDQYAIVGKVNWVTPKGVHGARAPGIGIQFEGNKAKELNNKIKQLLVLELQSNRPTYTM